VRHLGYVAMLLFCVLGTLPLEPVLGVGVYRRAPRLALTLLPVVPLFVAWDLYAVARGHWDFDHTQLLGPTLPGGLPVEEVAFFVVVPLAAVLTLEAVRTVRGWAVGDEVAVETAVSDPGSVPNGPGADGGSAAQSSPGRPER
jgi:lycopene cyclase domain-containing protein